MLLLLTAVQVVLQNFECLGFRLSFRMTIPLNLTLIWFRCAPATRRAFPGCCFMEGVQLKAPLVHVCLSSLTRLQFAPHLVNAN